MKDNARQINTFIYSIRDRADDILHTFTLSLDEANSYDEIIEKFEAHFVKKRIVIFERS